MRINIKSFVIASFLALICGLTFPQAAAAATPITIQGNVYSGQNQPVVGVTVVAWCGGVNFFGGSGVTDASGHYIIRTNSDDCPLGTELTVTTDIDNDGLSDGAMHTQTHSSTVISITLGKYGSIPIPEYDWIAASVAVLAGLGIVGWMRRPRNSPA